jgi:hypothetical protein
MGKNVGGEMPLLTDKKLDRYGNGTGRFIYYVYMFINFFILFAWWDQTRPLCNCDLSG